jgi:hypothetical protein
MMNEALLSALAALTGSALGGIAPIVSNYVIQRGLTERELLTRELGERQALYSDFIQLGITLYVRATTRAPEDENVDDLVQLWAIVSRIRLYASEPVIDAAQEFASVITKGYGSAPIPIEDLRNATLAPHIDPLNSFSKRCREELRQVFRHRSPVIA